MTKKSITSTVSVIMLTLAIVMLMITPTSTAFTDEATTDIQVSAGHVNFDVSSLSNDFSTYPSGDGGSFSDVPNLFPGSTFTKEATVVNTGEVAFSYIIADQWTNDARIYYDALEADVFVDDVLTYSGPASTTLSTNHIIEPGQTNNLKITLRWVPNPSDSDFQAVNFTYSPTISWTMGYSDLPLETSSRELFTMNINASTGVWYPRETSIEDIYYDEAWISWKSGDGFRNYNLEYSTNSDFSNPIVVKSFTGYTTPNSDRKNYPITYLEPGTIYYVRMQAVDSPVPDAWSPVISFTTLEDF